MHLTVSQIQLNEEMYELGVTDQGAAYFGRLAEHAELALFSHMQKFVNVLRHQKGMQSR
ncbi:hypothetical protein OM428_03735 [Enterococcus gallinarum]|nr:hypothetical protein [Enterococcus gallinarum]